MPCSATSSAKQKKRLQRSTIKGLPPLKRYLNAWSRHHRSGGFGIHSPYAYRFVRQVWRQPLPYYAYAGIRQLQTTIKAATTREQRRKLDLISYKEARLLFRVSNFFNPARILQVGAATGVESVAMLEVSRRSRLFLYDAQLEQKATHSFPHGISLRFRIVSTSIILTSLSPGTFVFDGYLLNE